MCLVPLRVVLSNLSVNALTFTLYLAGALLSSLPMPVVERLSSGCGYWLGCTRLAECWLASAGRARICLTLAVMAFSTYPLDDICMAIARRKRVDLRHWPHEPLAVALPAPPTFVLA